MNARTKKVFAEILIWIFIVGWCAVIVGCTVIMLLQK